MLQTKMLLFFFSISLLTLEKEKKQTPVKFVFLWFCLLVLLDLLREKENGTTDIARVSLCCPFRPRLSYSLLL